MDSHRPHFNGDVRRPRSEYAHATFWKSDLSFHLDLLFRNHGESTAELFIVDLHLEATRLASSVELRQKNRVPSALLISDVNVGT